jgi:hypothetical protein
MRNAWSKQLGAVKIKGVGLITAATTLAELGDLCGSAVTRVLIETKSRL